MALEEDRSLNGKGKKRNPFRRKQNDGSENDAAEHSATTNRLTHGRKLRWAQHLGQRDHASTDEGAQASPSTHPWKVPSGKKLHWSPRLGQNNKSHDANNGESRETSRTHPWNETSKNHLGLHWSPRPGHKSRGSGVSDDASSENGSSRNVSSENGSSRNGDAGIPRHVVASEEGGSRKQSMWRSQNVEFSDSISDDISEQGSTKKENVVDRIHRIRRQLNPRGKKAHWRYRIGEHRIDEEEEHHLPLGSELDLLEGFCHQMPEGQELFSTEGKELSPNRRRSSTEPTMNLAGYNDHQFLRVNSLERNASPQNIRGAGSFDSDIISLRGGHSGSTCSIVSDSMANRRDSDVMSLGATSIGAAPGILPEESPTHTYRKGENKAENKEYRVKPYHCFDPPVYMTESEIHEFMLQPSQKVEFLESFIAPSSKRTKKIEVSGETERIWGTTDDGRVGSLRVEVLGCVGLASVKPPDVSAYLICGDVPFVTDVIHACRSPRWPPTCTRAVVFPVHHAYARLFAGVFASKKDKANDEFCGRIVLDLASLRPNTEYDVTLPLRASSFIYDRRPRGVIRLRFSLHWFSERAAVMSYLKSPHSLVPAPLGDNPYVLCGDPKTFRNVAITVYGQDLPGKFTRKAFQATMREFNLTRLNLIFLAKTLATETVLYEKPFVSLYIFVTWMHCVYADSVKLAPAYFIGFLILCLFNNYENYNQDQTRYLGYAPPTLQELLYAMVSRSEQETMQPLLVDKKAAHIPQRNLFEKQHSGSAYGYSQDFSGDIEPLDHREFPFSEKLEYPRFRPEDAIVQTKHSNDLSRTTTPDHYLYGRVTEYASEKMNSLQSAIPTGTICEEEDEWEISDNEEELDLNDSDHMPDDGDNVFMQSDDEDDEEEGMHALVNTVTPIAQRRRIPIGPPQNCDVKPVKRVPPQVVLARAENMLHSLTFGLSMDKLIHSSLAVGKRLSSGLSPQEGSAEEASDTNTTSLRKKRSLLDDFDKRLGLRTRSKNPVVGITSSFLGPIMRMFRIFLIATRVVFNIGVWKDPFLSFWVLCFLVALMLILFIFPWRSFMFLTGFVCFGPQNVLVRRRLLHQAAEAEKEEEEQTDTATEESNKDEDSNTASFDEALSVDSRASDGTRESKSETIAPNASTEVESAQKKLGRRRRLKNKFASMREKRRIKKQESLDKESMPQPVPSRPAFCAATYQKASKVPLEPREVVVPYTRVRTERFYDWPPDPTLARATPVFLSDYGIVEESLIPSPSEAGSTPQSLRSRRRVSSEL